MLETILKAIEEANNLEKLEEIKKEYIGKKWKISLEMRNLKNLEPDERRTKGQELGTIKKTVEAKINEKFDNLHIIETNKQLEREIVDITTIAPKPNLWHFSKIQIVRRKIEDILQQLAFDISYGNEIVDQTNDELFLLGDNKSLRTYLSVEIEKTLKLENKLIKKAIIGKVYKNIGNSLQNITNWQLEWIVVGQDVNLANILDIIKQFSWELLGDNIELRFRPGNFPYSKLGIAWDMACVSCKGKWCDICHQTWWIELFGIGNLELEKKELSDKDQKETPNTFIFSIDITKLTAIKYSIKDLELFQSWDLRFVRS